MSNDTLRYSNNLLLMIDNSLALCCCEGEDIYWEAVPCDLTLYPRTGLCAEWDQCQYANRVYVSAESRCRGTANLICECQSLTLNNWNLAVSGKLTLSYSGSIASGVEFNSDPDIYASNLQLALREIIGSGIQVNYNEAYSSWHDNIKRFEITFADDLCGIAQTGIIVNNNDIQPAFTTATMGYGKYADGFGYLGPDNYIQINSSGTDTCPYENILWPGGPAWYDSNISCCPQKGAIIGPRQSYGLENLGYDVSGYCYGGCTDIPQFINKHWANLERTVIIGTGCFQLSPYYFLFGKEGRFTYDYYYDEQLFITPDCNFGSSGSCEDILPCNCNPQLFMPQFHKDVPWGVFGSYYTGIETDIHKAYTFPYNDSINPAGGQSYLSAFIIGSYQAERVGFDYRPFGSIKTRGTWQDTKEIEIRACIKRPIPFYIGTEEWDDIDYYIEIEPSSVSGISLSYSGDSGCGCFTLLFQTSGKTVGQFIDTVNRITAKDYGCSLFAFCAASADARNVPASKIINTSSELFEQKTIGDVPGDNGPESDEELYSGSEILVGPKRYQDTFKNNPDNPYNPQIGTYNAFPVTASSADKNFITPPVCRLYVRKLPRINPEYASDVRNSTNAWWTAIQGCRDTVINIGPGTGYLDPFTSLTVNAANRLITVVGSGSVSGIPFSVSGSVNTNVSGHTYTALQAIDDLNTMTFTSVLGTGTYNPVFATSGQPFDVWLDDSTWDLTGTPHYSSGTTQTTYNYSYLEPLLDTDGNISILSSSGNLESWIRRRCRWSLDGNITVHDFDLPYCAPPNSTKENSDARLDCAGDRVTDAGWVISQGCSSFVCKTRYYLRADRCPCDTVYRCNGETGSDMPHPFNQLGDANNSTWKLVDTGADYYVTQPTLYICELNFHPDCDIPVMLKVPFQIVNMADHTDIAYQDGSTAGLPGYCEFCGHFGSTCAGGPRVSNFFGWCQYLDPQGVKVQEEDIPREIPAVAYMAERSNGTFCSVNPWNFDPKYITNGTIGSVVGPGSMIGNLPQGCANGSGPHDVDCASTSENYPCPSCDAWDNIVNVHPVFTTGADESISLTVLVRPIVNEIDESDVCPSGVACNRLDINCSTVCCECFYICNPSNNGCRDDIKHDPYTQTTAYSESRITTGLPGTCGFVGHFGPGCPDYMQAGICQYPLDLPPGVTRCAVPHCYDGHIDKSSVLNITMTNTTCGCSVSSPCSTESVTASISCPGLSNDCGSGCFSWISPDVITPDPACYSCANFPSLAFANICCGSGDCDCTSMGDRGTVGCDTPDPRGFALYQTYTDTLSRSCGSGSFNDCGYGSSANVSTQKTIAEGISCLDATALGYVGTSCNDPYEFTTTVVYTQNLTVNAPSYASCNGGTQTGESYNHIMGWLDTVTFVCGLANINYASGIANADPRFEGSINCSGV